MAYQKLLVDNVTCSRRFHITFDDSEKSVPEVRLKCPFCDVIVFSTNDHPPARIARQENLVNTGELSDNIVRECKFIDIFSEKTIPHADRPAAK